MFQVIMDSCAYQDAIYHPYDDMKKSSDALSVALNRATEKSTSVQHFRKLRILLVLPTKRKGLILFS